MNLKKLKITSKGLYWGLIATFLVLYACVGFVSTLHSITFFELANNTALAVLLGITYEIGQASVLFSILMTKGKEKFLPWALMFLLTALQVTANVYASFKFMAGSGSNDYVYWQKSILFGVQASSPEMYQVIISWISGALLPVVALGMTALVAQNIKMMTEDPDEEEKVPVTKVEEIIENEVSRRLESEKPKDLIVAPEIIKKDIINEIIESAAEVMTEPEVIAEPSLESLLPTREDQLTGLKNAIVNNIQQKASDIEDRPLIGEGGVQIVKPPIIINVGPETQEEANAEYAKSLDPEVKIGEGGVQVLKEARAYEASSNPLEVVDVVQDAKPEKHPLDIYEDLLDEEVARLTEMQMPDVEKSLKEGKIELLPADEVKKSDPAEEIKPVNKVQGWHFKKEFIDDAGNIFEKGKYVRTDPTRIPKKA